MTTGVRPPELHITVMTGAEGDVFDLTPEIELVKAALLYADRVTLVSPKVAMLRATAGILESRGAGLGSRLADLMEPLMEPEQVRLLRMLRRKRGRQRPAGLIVLEAKLFRDIAPQVSEVEGVIRGFTERANVAELERAQKAKLLVLDGLSLEPLPLLRDMIILRLSQGEQYESRIPIAERMTAKLVDAVGPAATTFPVFDQQVSRLLRAMIDDRRVEANLAPATHAGLAGHLVGTLEAFPGAPMDEVIDVRRALNDPLVRFRSAVTLMTRELEVSPLDATFPRHADDLYREHVAPALLELEENTREARLREQLVRQVTEGAGLTEIKAALTMTFAAYALLPDIGLAAAAGVLPGAAAALDITIAVGKRRRELEKERRTNKFLFLFEAGRRLAQ